MRRLILLTILALSLTGCTQWKRFTGADDGEDGPPPCSQVVPLDVTLTDQEIMDSLTQDQRTMFDNTSQFYDVRFLDTIQRWYDGRKAYPAAGFTCLNETQFRRVVEAAVHLSRLNVTL